jgi:2-polyprenyl-3-methyl-5-hydroxy-6-metoxy-1,4-benzoquinol methylase
MAAGESMAPMQPAATHDSPPGFIAGNYFDKYGSHKRIHRLLVGNFVRRARELLALAAPTSILEVGCGNGDLAARLTDLNIGTAQRRFDYIGTDVSEEMISQAQRRYPARIFRHASAYALPFASMSFDLVIACEVLEHLTSPADALAEVQRVCKGHLLVSVPWEPCWRILNVLRGKYLTALGNTPGHVQHFSRGQFRRLVTTRFHLVAERRPFPWTMLLANARGKREK